MISKNCSYKFVYVKTNYIFLKEECSIAYQSNFTFVGEVVIPKEDSLNPLLKKFTGGKDGTTEMVSLNFGVKTNRSIGYVELFGMKTDIIYTIDTENEKTEIPWEDRLTPESISSVANFKKHIIKFASDTKEFISDYDAACYIAEHIKDVSGQVEVSGTVEKEPYLTRNGEQRFKDRYIIKNIKEVTDQKPGLKIKMALYYNKDSVDRSDFKKEQIVTVDAYVLQYLRNSKNINKVIGEAGRQFFMPQRVVLNASKFDFKDPKDKAIVQYRLNELDVQSSKKLYCCYWECALISGAEEIEFDESQLTSKQRTQIELGLKTLDDFRPRGNIFGPRIHEIRLVDPDLRDECADGAFESDYTMDEFEDMCVHFLEPDVLDDVIEKSEKDSHEKTEADKSDDFQINFDDDSITSDADKWF